MAKEKKERKNNSATPIANYEEKDFDTALRPFDFSEFVGQNSLVDNLKIFIAAAKKRNEPLDHVLLTGPPGLGKTTLAYIIAHELNSNIKITSGPVLEKPGDLAGILTNLNEGDILFIDEIHRLNSVVEEYLYPAMEEFHLDIMVDSGPNARTIQIDLPKFTLVGATTRAGLLTSPLRSRFGINNRLDYYKPNQIFKIVKRSANILKIEIDDDGAEIISNRSRGTPRIANRLLKRCRDFAQAEKKLSHFDETISREVAEYSLEALQVDTNGLDETDKKILLTIIEKFNGGPVGISTISAAVGEDAGTIEEVYEPYLMQEGFLKRTPRGREATEFAYKHFNLNKKNISQEKLF